MRVCVPVLESAYLCPKLALMLGVLRRGDGKREDRAQL
jgi:hypothetical protein